MYRLLFLATAVGPLSVSLASPCPSTFLVGPQLSLRDAVFRANQCPGNQRIEVPAGNWPLDTCEPSGMDEGQNLSGDLDVNDPSGGELEIVGALDELGRPLTTLEQQCPSQRLIEAWNPLTLRNLRLTGGGSVDPSNLLGGAVLLQNLAPLLAERCEFHGNSAEHGGAVYGWGGYLRLVKSSFTDNQARSSGGAVVQGGPVGASSGHLYLYEVTFENNHQTSAASPYGGGAVFLGGPGVFDNVRFIANRSATHGGALFLNGAAVEATTFLARDNLAASTGGAIRLTTQASVQLSSAHFINNRVEATGSHVLGGAIAASNSAVKLQAYVFQGNRAQTAGSGFQAVGGAVALSDSVAELRSGHFNENGAEADPGLSSGGAMAVIHSSLVAHSSTFSRNRAFFGGAASVRQGAWFEQTYGTFSDNESGHGGGGALFVNANASVVLRQTRLRGNRAATGGAAFVEGASFTAEEGHFEGNQAVVRSGALYAGSASMIQLIRSTLSNNQGAEGHGALGLLASTAFIENSTFTQNLPDSLHATQSNLQIARSTFARNGDGRKPTLTASQTVTRLTGSYIGENAGGDCDFSSAIEGAPYTYSYDTDASCLLDNASSTSGGPAVEFGPLGAHGGFAPTLAVPLVAPIVDAYHAAVCQGFLDQAGQARPQGAGCDIGATEWRKLLPTGPTTKLGEP